ncbi:MAG: MFS transporter [Wenzhouxiangellaceae bacterium]
MLAALKKIPLTVWLLGAVSFLNDAASEWVYPLLPLYLSSVLMAGPRAMGIIEGIAEATSSLLKLFSGVWVDRTGKAKAWVIGGYSLAALSRPFLALASSWPVVLLLRFLDRVGKGLRGAPRDVLIANSAAAEQRGLAFGIHRACDHAGAVAGPLMAALLLSWQLPLREVILWAAAPGLLAAFLTLWVREPQRPAAVGKASFDWRLAGLPPAYQRYLLALGLFTLGNASNLFILLRASELGIPQVQVPIIWALVSAVATVFSGPLSAWSDRIPRRRLIVAGWSAYAGFYLALGWWPEGAVIGLWPLFAVYGVFIAATEGVEKALVADLAPAAMLGRAFGWYHLVAGLLLLPASLLFGHLWQVYSAALAFTIAAVASLAGVLVLLLPAGRQSSVDSAPG